MTNSQLDAVADRVVARLMAVIDAECPPPKGISCDLCSGKGFNNGKDGVEFCSCEAGKIARRRQAIMNRMICLGAAEARKAQKRRALQEILPGKYDPREDPDHPKNRFGG